MVDAITLDMNTPSIQYLCKKDKRLAKVISMVGPITYVPHHEDPYSFLVHEIIEQMLSVKAGQRIYGRLEDLCGGRISPEKIQKMTDEQIRSIGTSYPKVRYIRGVTDALLSHRLDFDSLSSLPDAEVIRQLTKLRGVGKWTAKMYLIFVLNRQDVLPTEDGAFLQAYRWLYKTNDISEESIKAKCKKWKPYSSIASRYMYRALDNGLTKEPFHLFK